MPELAGLARATSGRLVAPIVAVAAAAYFKRCDD